MAGPTRAYSRYATAFISFDAAAIRRRHRRRQDARAGRFGRGGMAGLVGLHRLQDRAAARVGGRQRLQVLVDVRLDLVLGLDHEAQVPAVAAQAGERADRVAAGVPQRVEQARAAVEFAQAVGAPGQVVGFLLRRLEQVRARGRRRARPRPGRSTAPARRPRRHG